MHIICLFYTAVVDVVLIVGRLDIMITSKMLYKFCVSGFTGSIPNIYG